MHLLLHGICPAELPAPEELLGLRDRRLARVEAARLVAYATVFDQRPPDLNPADMLTHHRIVGELHAQGACLPARFPTWLDEGALSQVLERRSTEFEQGLDRIRGRVELAVTVLHAQQPVGADVVASTPGRRYMLQRQRALQLSDAARKLSAEIQRELSQDVIEARESVAPRPGVALSLALLVPLDAVERIRASLQDRQGIRILVSGPWPPYTFAVVAAREA